jgi:hypothetical protein
MDGPTLVIADDKATRDLTVTGPAALTYARQLPCDPRTASLAIGGSEAGTGHSRGPECGGDGCVTKRLPTNELFACIKGIVMFIHIQGPARRPKAMSPSVLFRVGASILAMSALGICFRRPHRLLPPTVLIGSAGFCLASLMFFAAAALRDSVVGGIPPATALTANGMTYGALLLVSIASWIPEFTLYLCISMGINLVATCLALTGFIDLNGEAARSVLFVWELAAMFTAMVQLRLSRLPDFTV